MQDFLTVEQNLRTAMRFFGGATSAGEIVSLPGVVVIYSGLDYGVFNIALLDRPVTHPAALETLVAETSRYFKARKTRWSFWICEDLLELPARRRARQLLGEFGLRAISHPPGMIATGLQPPVRRLPDIDVQPVAGRSLRCAFAEITALSFDIPFDIAEAVYTQERAWRGEYQGYVGLVNGAPASIVAIVVDAGAIGVYSLATDPSFRRRGYAEAVMRQAVRDAQARTGIDKIVLQSTEIGYPLYRRMGFHDATRFSVYLTK
jgi:GNAT superfamily N-acetyltransferase